MKMRFLALSMVMLLSSCGSMREVNPAPATTGAQVEQPSPQGPPDAGEVAQSPAPSPSPDPVVASPSAGAPAPVPAPAPVVAPAAKPVVVPGGTDLVQQKPIPNKDEGQIQIQTVPGQAAKKVTYSVKSNLAYMKDVATVAECIIHDEDFLAEVAAHKQFFDTKLTSPKVAENMRRWRPVVLSTYYKPLTSTIAYRNVGDNVLYFNTYRNPRAMKYMANTAVHEWLHVQDFGHSYEWTKNRDNSVPYAVGDIAEKYSARCNKTKTK